MRILVVGAGAIGGYFGGRLLAANRDVTFLVRPERARRLAADGLLVTSPHGDLALPAPPTVQTADLREPFDLVILSCKAYDLDGALEAFAPAVGPATAVLPLLNGMRHLDALDARFGADRILGGLCVISTTLDPGGRILHLNALHNLTFGERDGTPTRRIEAIDAVLGGAGFESRLSGAILQEMWEKWVFIASAAGLNCLLRGTVGDLVAAGGGDLAVALIEEAAAIAALHGFPPGAATLARVRGMLTEPGSGFVASMLRDLERGAPIEADHVVGDLLRRAGSLPCPVLGIAHAHLKTYEARRKREAK